MKRLSLFILGAFAIGLSGFTSLGGWAVVSVSKVPDAWIAGKPLQLSWQVRAHGHSPVHGLMPTLEARSGARRVTGRTWEFDEDGQRGYRGSIAFPASGNWQVTIHSGFGRSRAVLLPWRVVDSVSTVRGTVEDHLARLRVGQLSEPERGRRMFAAKGCVSCHVHRSVPIAGDVPDFGPDLTHRQFSADYLRLFLANPSIKPSTNGRRMPNLGLRDKDIAPLVAFLTAPRTTGRAGAP